MQNAKRYAQYRFQMAKRPFWADPNCAKANLGDNIQYLVLGDLFESLGIKRETILDMTPDQVKLYRGERLYLPGRFIINDREINRLLPCPEDIIPLLISSSVMFQEEEMSNELVDYLKRIEPIGCRDEQTRTILRKLGVEAYLMGCFTMCLPQRTHTPENGKTFLVDVSKNLWEYIPDDLKKGAVSISHAAPVQMLPMTIEEDDRLNKQARDLLDRYAKEANLVITSRLHAAAPCIAMGIPVILASDNIDFRYGWLDKYIPIYTIDEYDTINWEPVLPSTEDVKRWIPAYIQKRLIGDPTAVEELKKLDDFYMDRERVDYYGYFTKRIRKASEMTGTDKFKYIIWGAGQHGGYAYDIIRKLYPKAELLAVIDKYEKGMRFGKRIITGDQLKDRNFDVAFITTKPGTPDAILKMQEFFGNHAEEHYIKITSQQDS